MKTLIVAGNHSHATYLRSQAQRRHNYDVSIIAPGDMVPAQRYDLIVVSDTYTRERLYAPEDMGPRMDIWFESSVTVRLSGPDARMIRL